MEWIPINKSQPDLVETPRGSYRAISSLILFFTTANSWHVGFFVQSRSGMSYWKTDHEDRTFSAGQVTHWMQVFLPIKSQREQGGI